MFTPSAIIHWLLIWRFFHANFRLACSHFRTLGHFLYSRKSILFGPGVDLFLLSFTIHLISSCVGGFISNSTLGLAGKTRFLLFSRGICRLGSVYISLRYFSRRFFSDFSLSNMFFAYLYDYPKIISSFICFIHVPFSMCLYYAFFQTYQNNI